MQLGRATHVLGKTECGQSGLLPSTVGGIVLGAVGQPAEMARSQIGGTGTRHAFGNARINAANISFRDYQPFLAQQVLK